MQSTPVSNTSPLVLIYPNENPGSLGRERQSSHRVSNVKFGQQYPSFDPRKPADRQETPALLPGAGFRLTPAQMGNCHGAILLLLLAQATATAAAAIFISYCR
jgi:hypothetical protein